jgi:hypothetical protein
MACQNFHVTTLYLELSSIFTHLYLPNDLFCIQTVVEKVNLVALTLVRMVAIVISRKGFKRAILDCNCQ